MPHPINRGRGRPKQSSDVPLTGSRALDRNSGVPLYFQLATALREKLDAGAWEPGSSFPTEREIAEEFGVSRTVIRRALELLVNDGVIVLKKGSGAFVTPPRRQIEAFGLIKALSDQPDNLTLAVRTAREELPDAAVARFLDMSPQPRPVTHVTAVIHIEGNPTCLLDSYSPANRVPWLLPAVQELQAGAKPPKPSELILSRAAVSVELTFFGRWGGPQLGASAGDPALLGHLVQFGRTKASEQARPLEFAHLVYRADNTQLALSGAEPSASQVPGSQTP